MVSVAYSHRLLCDVEFIIWLLKQTDRNSLFSNLMHIKSSSEHWRKCHNLILRSNIESHTEDFSLDEKSVGAIFKIVEDLPFLSSYSDPTTKNIIFAVDITDERPFKCYILTSPDKEKEYKTNKHYNELKSVEVASGDKARGIIKDFFSAFDRERQAQRLC